MHQYDTILKTLWSKSPGLFLQQAAGVKVRQWLNVELPSVQQSRVDLLAEAADGSLIHIELQSTNDPRMPLRMAEYSLRVYRLFGSFPQQILLYIGNAPLRMESALIGPNHNSRYEIVDIRTLEAEPLIASPFVADNIVAILGRLQDRRRAVQRILLRIATLEDGAREIAFTQLVVLAGLRDLAHIVQSEVKSMPILDSILDHELIGPAIKQGLRQGLEQGREEGIHHGEVSILRRQLAKRFGPVPAWAETRLASLSSGDLEDLSERLLDAAAIEEIFQDLPS